MEEVSGVPQVVSELEEDQHLGILKKVVRGLLRAGRNKLLV